MEGIIKKFFRIEEVVKLDHKVVYFIGNMIGKVKIVPTNENVLFKEEYQYVGIYDSKVVGYAEVFSNFGDFLRFTGISPKVFYNYILDKYNSDTK